MTPLGGRRVRRRVPVIVLAVLVTVLATACADTSPAPAVRPVAATGPAPGVAPLTDPLPAPALRWGPCPAVPDAPVGPGTPGLSCAVARLPLDYTDPGGRTVDVTISRLSTGPGHPVLFSNPGGPGAPGLFNPSMWDGVTGGRLSRHYDLVGFDPRGVGRSSPVDCGLPEPLAWSVTGGVVPGTFDRDAAAARRIAETCAARAGGVAPHMTTLNTARDLDMIRKALGRDRVSFLGMSYGTELAITFASLFPGSTDRVVLDSAQDVTMPWPDAYARTAPVVGERFSHVARVLADGDDRYHLGRTPDAVQATYLGAVDRLLRAPVPLGAHPVTASTLDEFGLTPALLDDSAIDLLGRVVGHVAGVPGAATDAELLDRLGPDGLGQTESPLPGGQPVSQNVSIYWSIRCGDDAWPRDPGVYRSAMAAEAARWPVTRGKWSTITPCAFWTSAPREPRITITDRGWSGGPNVLILQNARDLRAADPGVRDLRRALGGRAVTVTANGSNHGVFWDSDCARSRTLDWMLDGVLPTPAARRC